MIEKKKNEERKTRRRVRKIIEKKLMKETLLAKKHRLYQSESSPRESEGKKLGDLRIFFGKRNLDREALDDNKPWEQMKMKMVVTI